MNREKNEKRSFDILYAFTNQLENLVRSTKTRVRVICIGNTLEEASDILSGYKRVRTYNGDISDYYFKNADAESS